jgi:hypothetical protein
MRLNDLVTARSTDKRKKGKTSKVLEAGSSLFKIQWHVLSLHGSKTRPL